jgi:hypothetical protein
MPVIFLFLMDLWGEDGVIVSETYGCVNLRDRVLSIFQFSICRCFTFTVGILFLVFVHVVPVYVDKSPICTHFRERSTSLRVQVTALGLFS